MKLVDANVLLYAVNPATVHHESSLSWLDAALGGGDEVGFAWNAVLAFVRISTNPRIVARPLSPADAMGQVHDWVAAPSARVVHPGERHAGILDELLQSSGTAANLVNDAHLAALAIEHRAGIVTFDTDFARFAKVRSNRPDELRPA